MTRHELLAALCILPMACFSDGDVADETTSAGTDGTTSTTSTTSSPTTTSTTGLDTSSSDTSGSSDGGSSGGSTGGGSSDTGTTGGVECDPAVPAICGRSPDGITCAVSDMMGGFEPLTDAAGFTDAANWNLDISNWLTIQFPDVDGDGVSDLCARASAGIRCALGAGDGTFGSIELWTDEFDNDNGWNDASRFGPLTFPDVDGDGSDDVCSRDTDGIRCGLSNGADGFAASTIWIGGYNDGGGWASSPAYWGTIQFPDVDGDGSADVCGRGAGGVQCALSNGSDGFDPGAIWSDTFRDENGWNAEATQWGSIQFPDIDGDGTADVCGLSNTELACQLSNGVDAFDTSVTSDLWAESDGWNNASWWGTLGFPDLDGDGDADVCGRTSDGIQCALSEGDAWGTASNWIAGGAYSDDGGWADSASYWATIQYHDFDGDGLDDVCGRGAAGIVCGTSNGTDAFEDVGVVTDFSDADGWADDPSYWRTIQFGTATASTCPAEPDPAYRMHWRTSALPPRFSG